MTKNNTTGHFDNIEEHLRTYSKTLDEKLFNAVIIHYLRYLALAEIEHWNTATYCSNRDELVHDLIAVACKNLPIYKSRYTMTCQSWCRLAMKQYLIQLYHKFNCQKNDRTKTLSLDQLLKDHDFDVPEPEQEANPVDDEYLRKFDKAAKQLTYYDPLIRKTVREALLQGDHFFKDMAMRASQPVRHIVQRCYPGAKYNSAKARAVWSFIKDIAIVINGGQPLKANTFKCILKCTKCGYMKIYLTKGGLTRYGLDCPNCQRKRCRKEITQHEYDTSPNVPKVFYWQLNTHQVCIACHKDLPYSEYYKCKKTGRPITKCKKCKLKYFQNYKKNNPQRFVQYR